MQTKQTRPQKTTESLNPPVTIPAAMQQEQSAISNPLPPEYGGRKGAEATRYGDWELNGKCVDF